MCGGETRPRSRVKVNVGHRDTLGRRGNIEVWIGYWMRVSLRNSDSVMTMTMKRTTNTDTTTTTIKSFAYDSSKIPKFDVKGHKAKYNSLC